MWHENHEEGVEYYITENFTYKPNLAIFSFNKTLVKNLFSRATNSLQLFSNNVTNFLSEIDKYGSIVIIENRFYKTSTIREQINDFIRVLSSLDAHIEFIAIFIKKPNRFRKPNTNIIYKLKDIYKSHDETCAEFEIDKSILVGSNAGRFASSPFVADHDDCDRAFAENIKIPTFRTPEQIFMNSNASRIWQWKLPHVSQFIKEQKNKTEPNFNELFRPDQTKTLIFITGSLASGKTVLSKRLYDYFKLNNIAHSCKDINTSNMGEICEYIEDFNKNEVNMGVIVDVLYDDVFSIYLNLVYPTINITYIEIEAYRDLCIFLDRFRLQISKSCNTLSYKIQDIAKWYITDRIKHNGVNYIKFPLILRTRPESFYRYTI